MTDSGWLGEEAIADTVYAVMMPTVATDTPGNIMAIWRQGSGSDDSIYARFHPAGGSWGTTTAIEAMTGMGGEVQTAFDGSGNAFAVWFHSINNTNNLFGNATATTEGSGRTADRGQQYGPGFR